MTDLRQAALDLAATGTAVFPCNLDKSPRTPRGFKDATTDPAVIEAWEWDGMIGALVPDGQIVVDVDPRNGGSDTMAALKGAGHHMPDTLWHTTGGGGTHRFYRVPDGVDLRSTLGPGVDIKKPGKGYVVVPPSPGYVVSSDVPVSDAPQWLLDELVVVRVVGSGQASVPKYMAFQQGTDYGLRALEGELGRLMLAMDGERNNALNRAAFSVAQLVAGGELEESRAKDDLVLAAERIGLAASEAAATLASGWEAGLKEPRQAGEKPRPEGERVSVSDGPPEPEAEDGFWLDWEAVEATEQRYLLDPVIPAQAYGLVYGATSASKSMAMLGVLSEGSWHGVRSTIYSLENPRSVDHSRLRRFHPNPENLRLTNQPIDFNDARQVNALIEREKEYGTDVILIDTYSHAFNSRSEDGNAKAIEFARRVRHVMAEVGCTVIVVDHTGFQGDEPRDASAKLQQVDFAILMKKRGEWRKDEPSRWSMENRKYARFANPFLLSGEVRDTDTGGLALHWDGDAPRWSDV